MSTVIILVQSMIKKLEIQLVLNISVIFCDFVIQEFSFIFHQYQFQTTFGY